MRVLGIDPGFDRVGFGIIDQDGGEARWVFHDCLQTKSTDEFGRRLQQVRDAIKKVMTFYRPDVAVVEQLFFSNNAKTAIKVGMARGVTILAIHDANLPLIELTPNQVKQGIAGWGGADKKQVQDMVQRLLKLKERPEPDDAADALALAIVGATIARANIRQK
jgi:crossover junction endodeoxyribonuclease RuvC